MRVVATFRSYAAQLCPRLTGSCSAEVLQQLCDVVRQGLVLVQGHSFLLGQEWQSEAAAMLGRAEQLKVLLAHRQAHHISLLAALLQLMHRQEVQEYDSPQQARSVHTGSSEGQPCCMLLLSGGSSIASAQQLAPAGSCKQQLQGKAAAAQSGVEQAPCAHGVAAAGLEAIAEAADQEDDEFYMPIAPVAHPSPSAGSSPTHSTAVAGSPMLPFDMSHDGSSTVDLSDDSLARMPSSGCSSLLEFVHSMPSATSSTAAALEAAEGSSHLGHYSSSASYQQQLRRITEEQLQSIAGVGLDDQAVVDLVDALMVNSSVVLLDLSHNAVEDIGARALARLLRERSWGSSKMRVMCLQHNQIGDDGAIALASSLSSNTQLRRLWLQHNAIGPPGAMALATAMQHNTSCTSLKLLQGNEAVPRDLAQMAQKLAWHNRGVHQRIKGLLQHVLLMKRRG
ncbi:hypothetical protein OEZ86_009567 [Tetradesmus obliquus]|nr:hypothetical protein OEZ86_009567 [Tetradesmus obliquus]